MTLWLVRPPDLATPRAYDLPPSRHERLARMSRHTTHQSRRLAYATLAAAFGTLAAGAAPATAATSAARATAATSHAREVRGYTIELKGSKAFPESVAADSHYVYTASIGDGTVYRGRIGAKVLLPFLPGGRDGRTQATGIKISGDRLLVGGAFSGRFFIYTTAGKLVSSYVVPHTGEPTLVNDEVTTANGDVYITDSFRPVIYRIPAAQVHAHSTGVHRVLQVAYRLPDYVAGKSNGNGIVVTPDGKSLVIGYYNSGSLYRLSLATGKVHKVAAPPLASADALVLTGTTLYAARAATSDITTLRLSRDGTRATVVSERTYRGG